MDNQSPALALAGKRIVVTQAAHQAPELAALLAAQGAEPLLYPCLAIEPPPDTTALDAALCDLAAGRFDWLVLTSANTVRVLAQRAGALALPPPTFARARVAAIGAATAQAAADLLACRVDLRAAESVAEGLAQRLIEAAEPGAALLLPQADIARPVLAQTLAAAGLRVTAVTAYRTTVGSGGVDLPRLLAARTRACGLDDGTQTRTRACGLDDGTQTRTRACGLDDEMGIDAITFTSASTVRNLLRRLADEGGDPSRLAGVCLAAIGPVTAAALAECGLSAAVVAQEQSLGGLVAALKWTG